MTVKLIKKPQDIQLIENGSWCWHNEIEEEVCDKIIKSANDLWETGKIENKQKGNVISRQRSTDVHFNNEKWIYDLVEPYMRKANKNAGWNYDISGMESYQIGKYSADISAHYDWHQDSLGTWNSINNTPKMNLNGTTRKISMSLILNDDYEGGELEIWSSNKAAYKRGSIIFFPSWMNHRVTPVTKGTRYSLVVWFVGAPFK
tara:strand:- start:449 stop:1057 length:609 start_codon:yes stop_codon:yes gene_type:complete